MTTDETKVARMMGRPPEALPSPRIREPRRGTSTRLIYDIETELIKKLGLEKDETANIILRMKVGKNAAAKTTDGSDSSDTVKWYLGRNFRGPYQLRDAKAEIYKMWGFDNLGRQLLTYKLPKELRRVGETVEAYRRRTFHIEERTTGMKSIPPRKADFTKHRASNKYRGCLSASDVEIGGVEEAIYTLTDQGVQKILKLLRISTIEDATPRETLLACYGLRKRVCGGREGGGSSDGGNEKTADDHEACAATAEHRFAHKENGTTRGACSTDCVADSKHDRILLGDTTSDMSRSSVDTYELITGPPRDSDLGDFPRDWDLYKSFSDVSLSGSSSL